VSVWACLPEARAGGVYNFRVHPFNGFISEPQAIHNPGPEILHQDIALLREGKYDFLALRVLKVHGYTLLPPVDAQKIGTYFFYGWEILTGRVPAGRVLDFDHFRTQIRQEHAAKRARQSPSQV
jgi:hypothetical protein